MSGSTLAAERGTNPRQLVIHAQLLEELVRLAEADGPARRSPRSAHALAQAFVEVRLFQLQNWRSLSKLAHGRDQGAEAATAKLYWSEMSQRLHATAMTVLGDARAAVAGGRRQPR